MKHKIKSAAALAAVIAVMIGVCALSAGADSVEDAVLRFHVIANSDSEEDQELKLKVRDAVFELASELTEEAGSREEAAGLLRASLDEIEKTARELMEKDGYSYGVRAVIRTRKIPGKSYGLFSLPSGEYETLDVIIGEGEGANWWCVIFPPLCKASCEEDVAEAAASAGFSEEETELILGDRYICRFRLLELWQKLMAFLGAYEPEN